MARKESRLVWRDGNCIELLENGGEFFPALCKDIDEAQSSVHLETYIFNLDDTGHKVLGHLRAACQRGVKVRVVIDGFGSYENAPEIVRLLDEMGAQVRVYRPEPAGLGRYRFRLSRLRRLHRKVTVVDDRIGFVGGINIIDDLVDVPDDGQGPKPRFDFAVRVRGPIVQDLSRAQSDLWMRMAWRRRDDWGGFYQRIRGWRERRARVLADAQPRFEPGMRATVLLRDNLRFRKTIENVYVQALETATHDALIANSYFFPGRRLKAALRRAARRGVRVRLLLQGRAEYALQYRACRSMYQKVLAGGIEIYEYQPSYLHAKVAVIDGCAMIGSSNMDPFSLLLARETNVFISDEGFADQLKAALERELANSCNRVTAETYARHSWFQRLCDDVSHFLLKIGVALTGRASEY
ncbi:cardiolipin synthase ClsB [Pusillimonas caeni]|uniref:cardiolipin synthase ClsB n=1 Tax=Pusillimonas caeni TaxID=1348472 RepID=UPI000E59D2AB|nr:cardiolipin synthase ClsB [Pusillimonas caeni]TFL14738.1 cardiolipin synthase ClsB [Pusillimonas caeni]